MQIETNITRSFFLFVSISPSALSVYVDLFFVFALFLFHDAYDTLVSFYLITLLHACAH